MSNELKELIEQQISYYRQHSIQEFVHGSDQRLRNFVVDDYTKLLAELEKELQK